jgi:hypothetical protein
LRRRSSDPPSLAQRKLAIDRVLSDGAKAGIVPAIKQIEYITAQA